MKKSDLDAIEYMKTIRGNDNLNRNQNEQPDVEIDVPTKQKNAWNRLFALSVVQEFCEGRERWRGLPFFKKMMFPFSQIPHSAKPLVRSRWDSWRGTVIHKRIFLTLVYKYISYIRNPLTWVPMITFMVSLNYAGYLRNLIRAPYVQTDFYLRYQSNIFGATQHEILYIIYYAIATFIIWKICGYLSIILDIIARFIGKIALPIVGFCKNTFDSWLL